MTMAEIDLDRRKPAGALQTVDRALLVLLAFERTRPDWG